MWIGIGRTKHSRLVTNSSCKHYSGSLLSHALSRMKTEECRLMAQDLVCNIDQLTPDSLPNRCPRFDENLQGLYIGCFRDSSSSRLLNGYLYKFNNNNSPSHCVNMCLLAGYSFAGVEYREECFCDTELTSAFALSTNSCEQYRCPNSENFCGGYNAIAVYRTGIIDKPLLIVNFTEPLESVADVRILFLLQLNGRNVRQIYRLLRIIYSPKHYYVIHVDKRQAYMFEEMKRVMSRIHNSGFDNFFVMERRYATIWAGTALLSMVLDVLTTVLHSLKWTNWDFMMNLSESDFPLLSMRELEYHLARNKERIFLSHHGYNTARFIQKQGLEYMFMQCEDRMWRLMKRSRFPKFIRLDGGSDWVVISQDFARYALSDDELPRTFRQLFKNVLLPVESFFHTLAANSEYCMQTVKGNLHLTNWKRQQGCRCAALKKIVDWCGCSPLVLRSSDIPKFSVESAQRKAVFFGRKFDPMLSQRTIAIAEAQALRFDKNLSATLLEGFARSLLPYGLNQSCTFKNLSSVTAYKESDEAPVQSIYNISCNGNGNKTQFIQILLESINPIKLGENIVNGYELVNLEIGSDLDLKEEIFRNYHNVLSEDDTIYAKLQWRRKASLSTSVHRNFTSPQIIVKWMKPSNVIVKQTTVLSYNSIFGNQYAELFSNETSPGEWIAEFVTVEDSVVTTIASIKFVIFSTANVYINDETVHKYFRRIDFCWETKNDRLLSCRETSWSATSSDPKSHFF
ncbi:unnamed protein product [Thelazia callipaeda]|uniref:protein xylosyltransferase n=1 Tax=Thelazia callipaeda TaxID=103827 RepID=A0A0N5CPH9_THECL|nr:unnamed protein product [Thelazia callipaeda]